MTAQDIHEFGLRFVYRELMQAGFKILSVEPDMETFPQIVATKEETLYFIVVQSASYPDIGDLPSNYQIKQIKEHAQKHNAILKFASIGLANAEAKNEAEKHFLKKGGELFVHYSGLKELDRKEN
ncbi:MAG TPA: hypothetical protein DCG69_08190 [Bacteroidales bacterium]|nr:hypothetical protein [Bacteroidales bacterium]